MVISKKAVFADNRDFPDPVVIAPDGDLETAVGRMLAARYLLPGEWVNEYAGLVRGYFARLRVIADPRYPQWQNIAAVQFAGLSDELVHKRLESALKSGRIKVPETGVQGVFDPNWTAQEYVKANAPILAEQINRVPALFTPGRDRISPHIASMNRLPFPAQAFAAQGVVNALAERDSVFISADMGTGKTQIALTVVHVLHRERNIRRVLITAPGIVVPKWAQEIQEVIPYAQVKTINSTTDALKYVREMKAGKKPAGLEIVLLSIDRAKFGPEPWCAAIWRRVKDAKYHAWHCPDCCRPLPAEEELAKFKNQNSSPAKTDETVLHAGWTDLVAEPLRPPGRDRGEGEFNIRIPLAPNGLPPGWVKKWRTGSKLKKCPYCGAKLWRPASRQRGESRISPRWYVCKILKNAGRVFDLYISDEIHQTKAGDSGRGWAFGQLVKCSKKVIGLTGTLTTGKSTSIKEILWRTDPAALIREGFDYESGPLKWAARYGVLQRTISKDDLEMNDEGIITIRKGIRQRLKELPGISPELTATYLLDRGVFLELSDIGLPLVEIKEIPVFIRMDEEHGREYRQFHEELHYTCAEAVKRGKPGAFSVFIPATINYADRPDLGAEVEVEHETVTAPAFDEDYYHAKERKLVEIVRQELAESRWCVIYTKYSGQYDINGRLKKVLEAHGIGCVVLPASVGPDARMEWLEEQARKGTKVIICNLELVEVGLDLLAWPTLIYYQLDYRVSTVRQSSRRAWRIGQTRECRVYYLVYSQAEYLGVDGDGNERYSSTQQLEQFKHVMAARGHAMFVEGRLDRSELARYALDSNTSLAYDIAINIVQNSELETLAQKWAELARKDMDQDLRLVAEKEFAAVVEKAKKELLAETLRLCGVDPDTYWQEKQQAEIGMEQDTEPVIEETGTETEAEAKITVEATEENDDLGLFTEASRVIEITSLFPDFDTPVQVSKPKRRKRTPEKKRNEYEQLTFVFSA
jgi:hypothetical protein